jgi:hypothetical protein
MPERLTIEEQRALKAVVEDSNEKAWAIGLGLTLAFGLFAITTVFILKAGSNVGLHLQLLRGNLHGYSVTLAGSVIPFIYAFVLGYLFGRMVITLCHRLAAWIGWARL